MFLVSTNFFNLQFFIGFLIGIVSGALLLFGIIMIIVSRSIKVKKTINPTVEAINDEKIKEMVKEKINIFKKMVEDEDAPAFKTTYDLSLEIIHEIASYYYPESPKPEYELSLDETLELIVYIKERIDKLLKKPIISKARRLSLRQISGLVEKAYNVANSEEYKATKDGSEAYKTLRAIGNVLNPVYWINKTVVNGTLTIGLRQVLKSVLAIVGDETNKVYSKKLFKTQNEERIDIEEIFNDEV